MALTNLVSLGVRDGSGKKKDTKRIPLYFPAATSLAAIQTAMTTLAPLIHAGIDGGETDLQVTLQLTLPAGAGSVTWPGQDVHNGANLVFKVANSNYAHTIFIPSWKAAGFAGDNILTTTPWDALVQGILDAGATDEFGNALLNIESGYNTRHK